jgi:uncharacterized protein (TIGR02391 family)
MPEALGELERIARNAHRFTQADRAASAMAQHPFVERDIHEALPPRVQELFDDGHYAEATYTAYKYLDTEIRRLSGIAKTGAPLMMEALNGNAAVTAIKLTPMGTLSEKDEQEGFRFLFAGSMMAIRNPRGHEHTVNDDLETCLGHLSLVTLLMRRLERAGYSLSTT